jgi:hypothetical protein
LIFAFFLRKILFKAFSSIPGLSFRKSIWGNAIDTSVLLPASAAAEGPITEKNRFYGTRGESTSDRISAARQHAMGAGLY